MWKERVNRPTTKTAILAYAGLKGKYPQLSYNSSTGHTTSTHVKEGDFPWDRPSSLGSTKQRHNQDFIWAGDYARLPGSTRKPMKVTNWSG